VKILHPFSNILTASKLPRMGMDIIREATERGTIIEIPRQFGKYTYVRTLGSATNSVILLADDRSGTKYAVKVVSRSCLVTDGQLEFFERELRLLQFIHHPNIVHLQDVLYLTDTIALVMEFCENGDLCEQLWHHGPMNANTARSHIYQILKALECFHEKGYAHRDLKPENILIDSRGRVKICDLGLARAGGSDGMMSTICGTIPYTPPEIVQGLPYDGAKVDIWSLGILIFVMVCGKLPWESDDQTGMVREIMDGVVSFPEDLHPELITIVRACTNFNPSNRPSASELLEMPWLKDEQPAYAKTFGIGSKGIQAQDSWKGVPGKAGTVGRTSVRMILMRPHVKAGTPERGKLAPLGKSTDARSGGED
jgi:serine/threonine protein kinase